LGFSPFEGSPINPNTAKNDGDLAGNGDLPLTQIGRQSTPSRTGFESL
jgi:hypothetical protein